MTIKSASVRTIVAAAFAVLGAACHRSAPVGGGSPMMSANPTPSAVTAAAIAAGDSIFNGRTCKNCHAVGGVGGPRGPNLTDQTWVHIDGSFDAIVNLVTTGFTKAEQKDPQYQFSMNPRGGGTNPLTDGEIKLVAAYVWSLSHGAKR